MLFSVDHHLGDSRKSAREVWASRLFCFTAGVSGSPNGIRFQAGWQRSVPVHRSTDSEGDKAIAALNGQELGGRALTINEARPKSEGAGRGRGFSGDGGGGRGN